MVDKAKINAILEQRATSTSFQSTPSEYLSSVMSAVGGLFPKLGINPSTVTMGRKQGKFAEVFLNDNWNDLLGHVYIGQEAIQKAISELAQAGFIIKIDNKGRLRLPQFPDKNKQMRLLTRGFISEQQRLSGKNSTLSQYHPILKYLAAYNTMRSSLKAIQSRISKGGPQFEEDKRYKAVVRYSMGPITRVKGFLRKKKIPYNQPMTEDEFNNIYDRDRATSKQNIMNGQNTFLSKFDYRTSIMPDNPANDIPYILYEAGIVSDTNKLKRYGKKNNTKTEMKEEVLNNIIIKQEIGNESTSLQQQQSQTSQQQRQSMTNLVQQGNKPDKLLLDEARKNTNYPSAIFNNWLEDFNLYGQLSNNPQIATSTQGQQKLREKLTKIQAFEQDFINWAARQKK